MEIDSCGKEKHAKKTKIKYSVRLPSPPCTRERNWWDIFYICRINKGLHLHKPSMRNGISLLLEEACTFRGNWRKFEGVKDELEGYTYKSLAKPWVRFKINTAYSSPPCLSRPCHLDLDPPQSMCSYRSAERLAPPPLFSATNHALTLAEGQVSHSNSMELIRYQSEL